METLPIDLVSKIFGHLTIKEIISLGRVCKTWREVTKIPRLWKKVDFLTREIPIPLYFLQSLIEDANEELEIFLLDTKNVYTNWSDRLSSEFFKNLLTKQNLKELRIRNTGVTAPYDQLKNCNKLQILEIGSKESYLYPFQLLEIAKLPNLKELHCKVKITAEWNQCSSDMKWNPKLEKLSLEVQNDIYSFIQVPSNLTWLKLQGYFCSLISNPSEIFSHKLQVLHINEYILKEDQCQLLQDCQNLTDLYFPYSNEDSSFEFTFPKLKILRSKMALQGNFVTPKLDTLIMADTTIGPTKLEAPILREWHLSSRNRSQSWANDLFFASSQLKKLKLGLQTELTGTTSANIEELILEDQSYVAWGFFNSLRILNLDKSLFTYPDLVKLPELVELYTPRYKPFKHSREKLSIHCPKLKVLKLSKYIEQVRHLQPMNLDLDLLVAGLSLKLECLTYLRPIELHLGRLLSITDDAEHLKKCTSIERIVFDETSDSYISDLISVCGDRLKSLIIKNSKVGDTTISSISQNCQHLKEFQLIHCQLVTPEGLKQILKCKELKLVNVEGKSLISKEFLQELESNFRTIKFKYENLPLY